MELNREQVSMFVDDENFKKQHPHQWRYLWTCNEKYLRGIVGPEEKTMLGFSGETGMADKTMAKMLGLPSQGVPLYLR
jgi:hypothetical protein